MPKKVYSRIRSLRPIFLTQWREYRGNMSQDRLLERMKEWGLEGGSISTISRVERGLQAYNQPFLEAAAWALTCEPWDILWRNPLLGDEAVWSIADNLRKATPEQKAYAVRILDALLKTGT